MSAACNLHVVDNVRRLVFAQKPQLVPGHEAVVHSCQAFVNSDSPCKEPQGAGIIRIVVLTKGNLIFC